MPFRGRITKSHIIKFAIYRKKTFHKLMTNVLCKDATELSRKMTLRGEGAWNGEKQAWEDTYKIALFIYLTYLILDTRLCACHTYFESRRCSWVGPSHRSRIKPGKPHGGAHFA